MKAGRVRGHVAMLGANVMWGLMAPATKVVLSTSVVSSLAMVDMRIFGAAALFWLTSLFCRREHVPAHDLLLLAGAAFLGVLFNQGCFIFGVGLTSPGEASIITTTMPMWVMVLAYVILREPITLKKAGGVAIGACGVLILVLSGSRGLSGGDNRVLGDVIVLMEQLSYALYLTFYRHFVQKYSLVTLMKWMFLFAALTLVVPSLPLLTSTAWGELTLTHWGCIGYVVVCGTYLAYICIMIGQKTLRPTVVGVYNYIQPIVATGVGLYLGLDSLGWQKGVAVVLIFGGVYLVTISRAARHEVRPLEG